ncbi:MAG: DUF2442 domain-containing protein [Bacteroidales bacterium]|nr:DUF2442 domain-containing protein [Bacteroidales bacterium]
MLTIKVTHAKYVEHFILELWFNDGVSKRINFEPLLEGEIFEPVKDLAYFKKFRLNPFTIEWENGADFAPEFLHDYNPSQKESAFAERQQA